MKTPKPNSDRRGAQAIFEKNENPRQSAAAVVHACRSAREQFCPDPNFSQERRGRNDLAAAARRADLVSILYF